MTLVIIGAIGAALAIGLYKLAEPDPQPSRPMDASRVQLPGDATFLRDGVRSLSDELRLASGKQFRGECPLEPGERFYDREPRELFVLAGDAKVTVVQSLRPLSAAFHGVRIWLFPNDDRVGGAVVRRYYERVADEYHSLLRRRWLLVSERAKDGSQPDDPYRMCVYGLREIDATALDRLQKAVEEAESTLRAAIAEELSKPRVPAFRIDLLDQKLRRAGLPFDGLSSPQPKPTPETDANPAEYFPLSTGQYLRATLPAGVTLTAEQRTIAQKLIAEHEADLRPSLFRMAFRALRRTE